MAHHIVHVCPEWHNILVLHTMRTMSLVLIWVGVVLLTTYSYYLRRTVV